MSPATCTIQFDIDPMSVYASEYAGCAHSSDGHIIVDILPGIADLCEEFGFKGTFFVVVGSIDSAEKRAVVRRIAAAGHEIACHTMTHPVDYARLDQRRLLDETGGAKARLEDIIGRRVDGFKGPGYFSSRRIYVAIAEAGYRYDSSVLPSWVASFLGVYQRVVNRRRYTTKRFAPLKNVLLPNRPYYIVTSEGCGLWEIPATVFPGLRLPIHPTFLYLGGYRLFNLASWILERRRHPASFFFHALDFFDIDAAGLDCPPLPGFRRYAFEDRMAMNRALISRIVSFSDVVTTERLVSVLEAEGHVG